MIARRLTTALLFALVVSGVFTFWLSKKFGKPRTVTPVKQQYVAAASNLDAGEVLRPANLKLVDWPVTSPLQGAFVKPEDLAGRVLLYPLSGDQPILERQLAAVGSGSGLVTKIPEGMRAISLKSDEIVGVAGFLLPGTHVDVLMTTHAQGSTDPVTSIVLQDVQILAAGQKMQPDPDGKATTVDVVTLLVTPKDAEKAVLASGQASIHFVLRNGADRQHVTDEPTQLSQLSGGRAVSSVPIEISRKPVQVSLPRAYSVETVAGSKQTVDTF